MPIRLDDMASLADASVNKNSPKTFFDSKLTGTGSAIGIMNAAADPDLLSPKASWMHQGMNDDRHHTVTNKNGSVGNAQTTMIPLDPVAPSLWDFRAAVRRSATLGMDPASMPDLGAGTRLTIVPSIIRYDHVPTTGSTSAKFTNMMYVCYRVSFGLLGEPGSDDTRLVCIDDRLDPRQQVSMARMELEKARRRQRNVLVSILCCNPKELVRQVLENDAQLAKALDYVKGFHLYPATQEQVRRWTEDMPGIIGEICSNDARLRDDERIPRLVSQMHYIEGYHVPLGAYAGVYAAIEAAGLPDRAMDLITRSNLNLLLISTLADLDARQADLVTPPPSDETKLDPKVRAALSPEQTKACVTDASLALVQAGAGTGKSTVIKNRANYLIAQGVPASDITIISFTNNAADHIKAVCPGPNSMTIAAMIDKIYAENHPTHQLSNTHTLANSLSIYYPKDGIAKAFRDKLLQMVARQSSPTAYTDLNNFVAANFDHVIQLLDGLQQTSLELEICITYQTIDVMNEPDDVTSRYLLVDETQDNSIFEFIFLLKYVAKHEESLFLVGDPSQTLYEFRSADCRAINVLEGSGVFAAYPLSINYRSNQEILDMANPGLSKIQANQVAHIQLQANSMSAVTPASFKGLVQVSYHQVIAHESVEEEVIRASFLHDPMQGWVNDCLAAHEQVAFISYKRDHANYAESVVEALYPNASRANIIPERHQDSDVISKIIMNCGKDIRALSPADIMNTLPTTMMQLLFHVMNAERAAKIAPIMRKMLYEWEQIARPYILSQAALLQRGGITRERFFASVEASLLDYEMRTNNVRQHLTSQRNDARKQAQDMKADFIFSTIHSMKGLEFDHIIVLYHDNNAMSEENKRLYYVALTRAIKSEYVLGYGANKGSSLLTNYEGVIAELESSMTEEG